MPAVREEAQRETWRDLDLGLRLNAKPVMTGSVQKHLKATVSPLLKNTCPMGNLPSSCWSEESKKLPKQQIIIFGVVPEHECKRPYC